MEEEANHDGTEERRHRQRLRKLLAKFRVRTDSEDRRRSSILPPRLSISVLSTKVLQASTHLTRTDSKISNPSTPPPPHLTLLGLPRELRDLIITHLYLHSGQSYMKQQLLGFPIHTHTPSRVLFSLLATCRQLYVEAFPLAYALTCFYWFRSYTPLMLTRLCARMNQRQMKAVRHLGFWSNPYLYEEFLDGVPLGLRLSEVTVCSNYMSGPLGQGSLEGRIAWILRTARKVPSLRRFNFLTGCGLAPGSRVARDCGFAEGLRQTVDAGRVVVEGVEYGSFGEGVMTRIRIMARGEGANGREVELKIASVYEDGFDDG